MLAGAVAVCYLYGHFVGYRDDAAGPVPAAPAASAEASASSIAGAP
ncbi:hypothetical protein ABZW10_11025 [Kitasatospora sp. NPDC004723]